jgi:hypothetical protein
MKGDLPPIDSKVQAAVIDSITAALKEAYVFADKAARMDSLLHANLAAGAYAITVGAGAPGNSGGYVQNAAGSSTGFGLTANGGGWGGNQQDETNTGGSGGSGGGGCGGYYSYVGPGSGTAGQGFSGGGGAYGGGGGGGAGGAGDGAGGSGDAPGAGGAGIANDISGTSLFYAAGGGGASKYGGGAAGGSSIGGAGGGGHAVANRGSGGGGNAAGAGGNGSDGVVIVRYPYTPEAPPVATLDDLTDVVAPANTPAGKVLGTTAEGVWGPTDDSVTVAHAAPTEPPARDGLLWVVVPA